MRGRRRRERVEGVSFSSFRKKRKAAETALGKEEEKKKSKPFRASKSFFQRGKCHIISTRANTRPCCCFVSGNQAQKSVA